MFFQSRYLPALFLAIAMTLVATLVWLTWRLIEQDRALVNQRIAERLESAADAVVASLDSHLQRSRLRLAELAKASAASVPELGGAYAEELGDSALVVFATADSFASYPADRLRYYPVLNASEYSDSPDYERGEKYEFQELDYDRACEEYLRVASPDSASRAGALVRLGRVHRKRGEPARALDAYDELSQLDPVHVAGLPAGLLACYARCTVYAEENQREELERESRSLLTGLRRGDWKLRRDAYRFYHQQAQQWLGQQDASDPEWKTDRQSLAFAEGAEWLWRQWQRIRDGDVTGQESHILWTHDIPRFLLWHATDDSLAAVVASPDTIQQHWLRDVQPLVQRQGVGISVKDLQGRPVVGDSVDKHGPNAVRTSAQTKLPCTLLVFSADWPDAIAELGGRRRLLLTGLGIAVLFVLAASYFIIRSVTRELKVARLQSSFVSAVSHEFRTPLASLRQLSELLSDGRVSSDTRRGEYYQALRRESERLHRLVEGLLDFGRMEAGAREYRFTSLDPAQLVREVVEEFASEVRNQGFTVDVRTENSVRKVRADREALGRAIWNLLDNAVKYSPNCRIVWIDTHRDGHHVVIRVRDQGMGIAPREQQEIFNKFFRSPSAVAAGLKGTGLGLAMVQQIVTAHNGTLQVDSRPGEGSTFMMRLPSLEDEA